MEEWEDSESSEDNLKRDREGFADEYTGSLSNLKKARYTWQIKKSKNDCKDGTPGLESPPQNVPTETTSKDDNIAQCSTSNTESAACSTKDIEPIDDNHGIREMRTQSTGDVVPLPDIDINAFNRSDRIRNIAERYLEQRGPQFEIIARTISIITNRSCHWQKEELGCAIVDNVYNRTLVDIGISPDPVANRASRFIEQTLQNQSIESAIRAQGLRANMSPTVGSSNSSGWVVEQASTYCPDFVDNREESSKSDRKSSDYSNETNNTAVAGCSNTGAMNETANLPDIENNMPNSAGDIKDGESVSDLSVGEISSESRPTGNINSSDNVDMSEDRYTLDLAVSTAIKVKGLAVQKE